jgi:hypothetical protein
MKRTQDPWTQAEDVAVRAGAIRRCELHQDITINTSDRDNTKRAYAMGTTLFKEGNIAGTREQFMDAIKYAIDFY